MTIKACIAAVLVLAGTELLAMRGRRGDESRDTQARRFEAGRPQEGSLRGFRGSRFGRERSAARPFAGERFGRRLEARDTDKGFPRRSQGRGFDGARPFAGRRDGVHRTAQRPFRSGQFAKFRTPQRFGQQRAFLRRTFRGHPWSWWRSHHPRLFSRIFPVYFYRVYGYYPPVYYDYYDTYGTYPVVETQVQSGTSFRACVQDCLNTSNLSVENCLGNCGGQG